MAKDTREYSVRMLEAARKNSHEQPDPNPVFMPVGRIRPETFNQALERIMSHSAAMGMTLEEAYNNIRGDFDDIDFDDDVEVDDFGDDEFEQSSFATYVEIPDRANPVAVEAVPTAPEPTQQPSPDPASPPGDETSRDSEKA